MTDLHKTNTLRLHRSRISGHAHRAELFLSLLGRPCELIEVDLTAGEQKRPEFLRLNAFGQVPVLEDGGAVVPDSNAILVYLAQTYDPDGDWLPREPQRQAAVQRWLSLAAGPLQAGPGAARLIRQLGMKGDLERAQATAAQLFGVMDAVLTGQPFLTGATATLADLAMYSYTAMAPDGDVSLEPYPAVRAWLQRIECLPGFVPAPAFVKRTGPVVA